MKRYDSQKIFFFFCVCSIYLFVGEFLPCGKAWGLSKAGSISKRDKAKQKQGLTFLLERHMFIHSVQTIQGGAKRRFTVVRARLSPHYYFSLLIGAGFHMNNC